MHGRNHLICDHKITNLGKKSRRLKSTKLTWIFEYKGDSIAAIIGPKGNKVIITSAFEYIGHVVEVHFHGDVALTAIGVEKLWSEEQRHNGHIVGVCFQKRDAIGREIQVGIVQKLPDGLKNHLQEGSLTQTEFQHLENSALWLQDRICVSKFSEKLGGRNEMEKRVKKLAAKDLHHWRFYGENSFPSSWIEYTVSYTQSKA